MENKKCPKKAVKKKRSNNVSQSIVASDSDESDNEVPDYNGIETTLNEHDDSLSSDAGWSSDDDRELVRKVKETSKQSDKVNYKTRLKQLNWADIAFKSYSGEDCEKRFQTHLKHVRRFRNLNEITTDIEANIKKCPLKKPLNSYQLFVQDQLTNVKSSGDFSETMKNLATLYKELPPEEKQPYVRKAELLLQEYKQQKQEFNSGIMPKIAATPVNKPKTPFMFYAENKKSEGIDYSTLRENYANASIDEKYKWILKAVSEAQDGSSENISKLLTKEEQRIFKGQIKSTPSAYQLYVKENYNKIKADLDYSKNVFTEIAMRWKSLAPEKKKIYSNAALILKERAAKEQEDFNNRHSVTPKKVTRRKSTYVEQKSLIEDDSEHELPESVQPKAKKQKMSVSITNTTESGSYDTTTKQIPMKSPTKSASPKPSSKSKIQSPIKDVPIIKTPEKELILTQSTTNHVSEKKKKKKSLSESSEQNDKDESDTVLSSTSTSSKKKSKKEKKAKTVEPPGEKPPSNVFQYFATVKHTGKPHKAKKEFDKLTKKERKLLTSEYNELTERYVERLRNYLSSLPKDEAIAYINAVKAAEDAEKDGEENDAEGDYSSQEY